MKNLTKHTQIELNHWYEYNYPLDNKFINRLDIGIAISQLKEILDLNQIKPYQKIMLIMKIKHASGVFRSISYLQVFDYISYNSLHGILTELWDIKSEEYHVEIYTDIKFTVKVLGFNNTDTKSRFNRSRKAFLKDKATTFKFGGYKLPNSMDITRWGHCIFNNDYQSAIVYKQHSTSEFHIQIQDRSLHVELKIGDKVLLTFTDTMVDKTDLSTFNRVVKGQKYYYEEGKIFLKQIEKKAQYLTKLRKSNVMSEHFITMDLETRNVDGVMIPYCISVYDGKNKESIYLDDCINEKFMMKLAVEWLLTRKYDKQKVYLHNFSRFDVAFLLSTLSSESIKLEPVVRDGRFLNLKLSYGKRYKIHFRDSLLILPFPLDLLTKAFNVEKKRIFPFSFVNQKNVPLDYVGPIPAYNFFDKEKLSYQEYLDYSKNYNNDWSLKKECIRYCEQDCISLHQVILKFSKEIWKKERVDVIKYPSLSSLAFAIFRTNYLNDSKIPLIVGEAYNFLHASYTGGAVDVYKPRNDKGTKVYRYDVNSLFPNVMASMDMPVGNPTYFEGDIEKVDPNSYGFYEVDIISPKYTKYPILQVKAKTNNGVRTIAPLGNWTGVYFSEELKNAKKFGYTYKIKKGYTFQRGSIFKLFVNNFYNWKLRSKRQKDLVGYLISKLILNGLYGRFGMSPDMNKHSIVDDKEAMKISNNFIITELIDLKNGKFFISYIAEDEEIDIEKRTNISISISSATTAG